MDGAAGAALAPEALAVAPDHPGCHMNLRGTQPQRAGERSVSFRIGKFFSALGMAVNPCFKRILAGRSGVIRTLDPHVPNVVRYQTALHSVTSGGSYRTGFRFRQAQNIKKIRNVGESAGCRGIFSARPEMPWPGASGGVKRRGRSLVRQCRFRRLMEQFSCPRIFRPTNEERKLTWLGL